jgi:hypothetical protein
MKLLKGKKLLEAVFKPLYTEEIREYGAENEEATEMRHQQECILSGGVHLRHRLEKRDLKDISLCFPYCIL